ncbi:MAG: helix-turn-helix transcriptional regulator [Clostridia bacterium]|nr:helix-turn-helix transcriptional regulator [Clostridia bacterium]
MKNRVEELRRIYGVRQEALAEAMGVSRQSIGSIENGRYNPSTILAIKLARYFGLTVEEVFCLEGEPAWQMAERLALLPEETQLSKNRAHNLAVPLPEGLIYGQANRYPSQFAYATFMTAHNGAEPVAIYNALTLLGVPVPFADILTELEGNGLALLDGYANTDIRRAAPLFSAHGVSARGFGGQADFLENVTEGDVFIITYWNDRFFRELKGLHTVAGTLTEGGWVFYNVKGEDLEPRTYRTLPEALRGKKFLYGYIVHPA